MAKQVSTVVIFGTPKGELLKTLDSEFNSKLGIIIDNGLGKDPVFSFYENLSRADIIVATPDAHPVHLTSLIAEGEVGHPLIRNKELTDRHISLKPILFYDQNNDWQDFKKIFSLMREKNLIRAGFDQVVSYHNNLDALIDDVKLSTVNKSVQHRINYYQHCIKHADLNIEHKNDLPLPNTITVSFFGSASTKQQEHLYSADKAASLCSDRSWNILHGGGDSGVMGRLSSTGQSLSAYVMGVTVDFSGAPKIFFERKSDEDPLKFLDYYIASKDMMHRIETYAGHSDAFIALDGGIGSIQEILIIAELLAAKHPVVSYSAKDGRSYPKPLYILNKQGIYTDLIRYLNKPKYSYLLKEIKVETSLYTIFNNLDQTFNASTPVFTSPNDRSNFRDDYRSTTI